MKIDLFRKGKRIRYTDVQLRQRFFMIMAIPFVLAIACIGYFFIYPMPEYAVFSIWYVAIVGIVVLYGLLIFFFIHSKRTKTFMLSMKHRERLAKFIVNNGYFDSEKTKDGQVRVTYFPKVYYKMDGILKNLIEIRFPIDMGKYQDRFSKLRETLETGLNADLKDYYNEPNYFVYTLMLNPSRLRLNMMDMNIDGQQIEIMQGVYWNFNKIPHGLIVGGTGSGKTFLLESLMWTFAKLGADITVCDPKQTDLSYLARTEFFRGRVFSDLDKMVNVVDRFVREMKERTVEFNKRADGRTGLNYFDVGLKPKILFFDEYNNFMDELGSFGKQRSEVEKNISLLVKLGRQVGVFLIVGMQRPDMEYFKSGARDNFGLRITLRKMSTQGYGMMFGDTQKSFKTYREIGWGYAYLGSGEVFEFWSPLVPKGFNFVEEFDRAYKRVEPEKFKPLDENNDVDDREEEQYAIEPLEW